MVTTIAADSSFLPRPQQITSSGLATGAYTYDGAGNIKAMGSDVFGYDSRSRLISSTVYNVGVPYPLTYQYDQYGNLNPGAVNPANNRLTAGVYDGRGNLTAHGAQRYDYDGLSRQTALNGGYERYLYDGAGERFARLTSPSVGTKLFTISPCRLLDTRFSPPAILAPRAVQLSGNCGVPSGATGVVGNLVAIPYGSGGFLTVYPTGTNPATSTLNFNASQVRANNFQVAVSGNGQLSLSASTTVDAIVDVVGYFAHDAPTWTLTMRDEANRLATEYTVTPAGSISRVKNYLYLGNLLAATRNSAGQYTYYASDHLGTPRATTGALTESHKYQPFGTEITSSFGNQPLKFAAMERDLSSGNDFDHARYQSSLLGRFLSPDMVLGITGNPMSWNRYAYANNNPLRYIDPTGLISATVVGCTTLQICTEEEITVTATAPKSDESRMAWDSGSLQGSVLNDLFQRQPGSGRLAFESSAAFIDGVIPFANPLEAAGAYDPSRLGLDSSREIGAATRDVVATLATMETATATALRLVPIPPNWLSENVFRWGAISDRFAKIQGPHFHLWPSIKGHLPQELRQWYYHTRAILRDALK